jgi:hypothetical protein
MGGNTTTATAQITNALETPLTELTNVLKTQGGVLDATLTKQTDVISILDREQRRLSERKVAVDAANVGQNRMVDLTRNASQRNRAINNMFITGVVALLLYLGIRFSSNLLPELAVDIMMILLVSITLLTLIMQYNDYIRRDNMDYDMINLGEPAQMNGKTSTYNRGASGSGILASRIGGGCIEDACCPAGTKYNKKFAICVPNMAPYDTPTITVQTGANFKYFIADKSWKNESTCGANGYSDIELACAAAPPAAQPFTTISGSRSTLSDQAKPYDAYEFSDYNLYK